MSDTEVKEVAQKIQTLDVSEDVRFINFPNLDGFTIQRIQRLLKPRFSSKLVLCNIGDLDDVRAFNKEEVKNLIGVLQKVIED